MSNEFITKNQQLWGEILQGLFPRGIPDSCFWRDPIQIANVLRWVGVSALTHLFYPTSGGNDFLGASWAKEANVLRLRDGSRGSVLELRPVCLSFRSIPGSDQGWAYFHLQSGSLQPSGVNECPSEIDLGPDGEEYFELRDGDRLTRSDFESSGLYTAEDLEGSSRCFRIGTGSIVIWSKGSYYNQEDPAKAYNAPHRPLSEEDYFALVKDIMRSVPIG